MTLSQNTLKKIRKSILVTTANGKTQTASSRLPLAVNPMLKVSTRRFDEFLKTSNHFPKPKTLQKDHTNVSEQFPKMFEDN